MSAIEYLNLAIFISQTCLVSLFKNELLIICQFEKEYKHLIRQRKNIPKALRQKTSNLDKTNGFFGIDYITIAVGSSLLKTTFPVDISTALDNHNHFCDMQIDDLIKECLSYEGSCGIVRMSDHKALFSNSRIMFNPTASPNDWVGKEMDRFWYPDELHNYLERLQKEGELRKYSYAAKLFDLRPVQMTVDSRIIWWHGEEARMVKTISRELLV
jgi:hypothetical protein